LGRRAVRLQTALGVILQILVLLIGLTLQKWNDPSVYRFHCRLQLKQRPARVWTMGPAGPALVGGRTVLSVMDETSSDDLVASGRYDWALTLLGIDRDAKIEQAKFAYRKLALKYHPDRNPGDKQAEEQFKKIDSAWKALEDILPPSPVPLDIPDGASEEVMEAIYVKWLLQPDQPPRYKQSKAAAPRPATKTQEMHDWSTVAS